MWLLKDTALHMWLFLRETLSTSSRFQMIDFSIRKYFLPFFLFFFCADQRLKIKREKLPPEKNPLHHVNLGLSGKLSALICETRLFSFPSPAEKQQGHQTQIAHLEPPVFNACDVGGNCQPRCLSFAFAILQACIFDIPRPGRVQCAACGVLKQYSGWRIKAGDGCIHASTNT